MILRLITMKSIAGIAVAFIILLFSARIDAREIFVAGNCKLTEINAVYTDCRFDSFEVKDLKLSQDKWLRKHLKKIMPYIGEIYNHRSDTIHVFSELNSVVYNERIYIESDSGVVMLFSSYSTRGFTFNMKEYSPIILPPGHVDESDTFMRAVFDWDIDYINRILKKNDTLAKPDAPWYWTYICYRLIVSDNKLKECTVLKFKPPYVTEIKLP